MSFLTSENIRRSMVNCSKGDAKRMTITESATSTDLETVEFLGWHDPRMPHRAYLITQHHETVRGVLLRPASGGARRTAMCALCRTTHTNGEVTLFTAPRAGAAGRDGNSVGTYICHDLACPATTRLEKAPNATVFPDLSHPVPKRVAALRARLDAFLDSIQSPTG